MTSYKKMEEVLKLISKKYISLDTDEVRHNNWQLNAFLKEMILEMKRDPLFKDLYNKPFFGGSYYDNLKIGSANEYDLDLLFVLPKQCHTHKTSNCECVSISISNKPGFLWFKVKKDFYTPLNMLINKEGYMQTDLVLNWLKSLIFVALNTLVPRYTNRDFIQDFDFVPPKYYSESGPALTLRLTGKFGYFDIDLVPGFEFKSEYWPKSPYRINPSSKSFFIVPKSAPNECHCERYWRASFQAQEQELIEDKERLKPSLRLLKKLRTSLGHHAISSYALKTIILWETDTKYFTWHDSLCDFFMKLLKKYKECLSSGRITYYWNKNNNLLSSIHAETLKNFHNEIAKKISLIEREYEDNPLIIAEVILKKGSEEYRELEREYNSRVSVNQSIGTDQAQAIDNDNGWGVAGAVVGVAAIALGAYAFSRYRNRNNND